MLFCYDDAVEVDTDGVVEGLWGELFASIAQDSCGDRIGWEADGRGIEGLGVRCRDRGEERVYVSWCGLPAI